jgi:O-succinylbenzoic acid--CoA ligase
LITILKNPDTEDAGFLVEVAFKAAQLSQAAADGKKFFLLPVTDPREAAAWIVASFHSPLAVVPVPAQLPENSLSLLLAQLPHQQVVRLDQLPPASSSFDLRIKPLDQVWAVIFSSGSTGIPKGVALSGTALRASAQAHAEHHQCAQATWLLNLPLYHVGGLSVLSRALFLESAVGVAGVRFSVDETKVWLDSGAIHGLSLVPTTLRRLLGKVRARNMKIILLGGAAATEELVEKALQEGFPIRLTYGMTEHCSQIASENKARSGLIPLPGVNVRTEAGEILVNSPMLALGYYQDGALVALPKHTGYFATGDLGETTGQVLTIHGRKSDLIISGGVNVFPAEIERELFKLPEIGDFAVTGIPDKEWGEAVCVGLVSKNIDLASIQAFLRSRLERAKVPKHFIFLPEIPRSPMGKVLRPALRAAIEKKILQPK